MGYISKYDTKFITYMNRKYEKSFKQFEEYIMWLFYNKSQERKDIYYEQLEKDFWEYSDFQTRKRGTNEETYKRTKL